MNELNSNQFNSTSNCPTQETLELLMDGTLEDVREIEQHLKSCEACRLQLDSFSSSDVLQPFRKHEKYHPGTNALRFLDEPSRSGDLGTIDHFLVEAEIGRGGAGIVFRCYDPDLKRHVAIKVLGNDTSFRSEARFERESQVAAKVRNDHLVSVHSIGKTIDGRPYLVMPFIKGCSLKQNLSDQLLQEKTIARILSEIAIGLQAIHDVGIVHRDVKPANILLDEEAQRAKLTDFGLAKENVDGSTLTQTSVLCGTPEYMSPEQALGQKASNQSDIYSLGVTLYECLTGTTPFRGEPISVVKKHIEMEPVPPRRLNPDVSNDLETVCLKAIAKEPARRYASAKDLAADLNRFLAGEPIHARPVSILEKLKIWSRRNRGLSVSLSLLALTLLASSIVTTWLAFQSRENARLATSRAEILQKRTIDLERTTLDLKQNNEKLRSALDTFFGRFLSDETFRMQLSTSFRNEMVDTMLDYYGSYLDQHPGDTNETLEVCGRIAAVTEYLLNSGARFQSAQAIDWNLHRLNELNEQDDSNLAALNLLAYVQLQSTDTHAFYHGGRFDGLAAKAIATSKLALEIDGADRDAQRNLIMAQARVLTDQKNGQSKFLNRRLLELIEQLDQLSEQHPETAELYTDRARLRRWAGKHVTPAERIALRTQSLKILQDLRKVEQQLDQTSLWTDRSIATDYTYRGIEKLKEGQHAEAEEDLRLAANEFRNLIASTPAFVQPRMDLAELLQHTSQLKMETGDLERSIEILLMSIAEFKQVAAMEKNEIQAVTRASEVHEKVANLFADSDDTEQAGKHFHEAVAAFQRTFLMDEQYVGDFHYRKYNELLERVARYFESAGMKKESQQYRNEAATQLKDYQERFDKKIENNQTNITSDLSKPPWSCWYDPQRRHCGALRRSHQT